jgi:hypothetical protein
MITLKNKFINKKNNEFVKIIDIFDKNDKSISIEDIKREYKCKYKCIQCENEETKVIRQIVEVSGFYCKNCTENNKQKKMNKIKWNKETIINYFNKIIIGYNIKHNNKKGNWIIPEYNWWSKYFSKWCGAITKFKIGFQSLLKIHNKNTKNIFNDEKELVNEFKNIYNIEGFSGLTPTSLNKNHSNIYNYYIYNNTERYKFDTENFVHIGWSGKNNGVSGCPSYWICYKLKILNERTNYLNNLLFNKTEEELINIIKKQKNIFNNKVQITNSDYTTEMRCLSKKNKKYDISYFRKLLNFRQNGYPTKDGKYICKSRSEFDFYNYMLKYNGINNIEYEIPIYKNKRWSIDWLITLENGNKIAIEIWGHNDNDRSNHKRKEEYLKRRKEKENEWNLYKEHYVFYGIEWEICQKENELKLFFENKLGLVLNKDYIEDCKIILSDDQQFYKEIKDIYNKYGFISTSLMNSSQNHRNQRYYGKNLEGLLKIMGIDKDKNNDLIKKYSSEEQSKTKKQKCYEYGIEKCEEIMNKLYIKPNNIIRVNQALFLKLSFNNCFWQNSAFTNFEILIDEFKKIYPKCNIKIAEDTVDWTIKCIDGLYILYSKVYEEYIEYYKKYITKSNGILTVPFKEIIDTYKIGSKTNFVRCHKSKIPEEYIEKLNKLKFVWDEVEYKNNILFNLIIEIKNYYITNKKEIKQITQTTKTKYIINNNTYLHYFPSIGYVLSGMRQNRSYKNVKQKLININDEIINILCGF